jgi:RNA polymerase sigma factor (sigma-70 family)
MQDAKDMDLLRDYVQRNSEDAFAELVQRHINLVYSVALRHVGIAAHAEEITQAVFIILSRKACKLRAGTVLEGWLYETTRLTALSLLRRERRRHFHEHEAFMQSTLNNPDASSQETWNSLAPLLDAAMSGLAQKDRDAVVLRFFKNKKISDVAASMHVSEAAAQRRILRALEKLRKIFAKNGVSSTTAILAGTISAHSVQGAPVGLANVVSAVALARGAAVSTTTLTLIKGALKFMAWSKLKTAGAVVGAVIIAASATTGLVFQHRRQAHTLAAVAASAEPQNLQGHWKGSNTAHPGQTCTLSISGDQIEYRGADPDDWLRGKFVLNDSTQPKQLNVTILEPANSFIFCIYRMSDDKITIAAAEHGSSKRPADFRPTRQVDVLELQRD